MTGKHYKSLHCACQPDVGVLHVWTIQFNVEGRGVLQSRDAGVCKASSSRRGVFGENV